MMTTDHDNAKELKPASTSKDAQQETPRRRTIRSFVRRQGRMTAKQKVALKHSDKKPGRLYLLPDPVTLQGYPGDLAAAARCTASTLPDCLTEARDRSVVLDIGFGMGESLVAGATAFPDHYFIGIEVYQPGIGALLSELEERHLDSVAVILGDVVTILTEYMPSTCLDRVQLFFPDPWPKRRHHKRRLITFEFMSLLAEKLKPGGVLHIVTDWSDYAGQIQCQLRNQAVYRVIPLEDQAPYVLFHPNTKFARRAQAEGREISTIVAVRD